MTPTGRTAAAEHVHLDVPFSGPLVTDTRAFAFGGMVLDALARHTCRVAAADWSCIFVRDKDDPRVVVVAAGRGIDPDLIATRFGADEGTVGTVLLSGVPRALADVRDLARPLTRGESRGYPGAAVPIRVGAGVAGVLAAARRASGRVFGDVDIELLEDLAELAAAAIEHSHTRDRREATMQARVDALAAAMAMRDRATASHSDDVLELAVTVGALLGIDEPSLLELEFAARLHDVGKIRVPDAVLLKPGPLDQLESDVIRCHPTWGADTLARIPGLEAVATIVRYHHERWDGGGYPDGLRGELIPLASRIIAACDAFGAMTSNRPYRDALVTERAIAELCDGAGSQFDPAVVEVLLEVVRGR